MTLPPLTPLRAFEDAARAGSYVAAAREIGVTPAAISQHSRKLEDFLGKQLFLRLNNRILLTDAGQVVFDADDVHQIPATSLAAAERDLDAAGYRLVDGVRRDRSGRPLAIRVILHAEQDLVTDLLASR